MKPTKSDNNKEKLLDKLPLKFTRAKFIELARRISINERTVERYMVVFCEKGLVKRELHGNYTNLTLEKKKGE